MCGIFGYYQRDGAAPAPGLAEAMGEMLVHRGPDDVGVFTRPGVALGNRRLSIIDVAGGHQPFVSGDGKIAVVQNGEIFNHVELAAELARAGRPCATHSDTEVLLRLYERDGIDMVRQLNGMFAIAIWDARAGALHLVRDRIGVKPLYVHDDGRRLLFASEIKALLRAGAPRRLNETALHHFLTYNYVPLPLTMFEGVVHLPPGHRLRIDTNGRELVRWWDLTAQRAVHRTEAEWVAEFNTVLDDAVRLRLRSDVPFGAFLSGGVDSSTVVGVMRRHLREPVRAYSIGFHEERFDESPYAEEAARRFGACHVLRKVDANMLDLWPLTTWHNDQPHGDISFLPTYRVSQLAAEEVKVVLTGDGADELFAGYDKHKAFFTGRGPDVASDDVFQKAYYENISLFTDDGKRALYTEGFGRRVAGAQSAAVLTPLFKEASAMDRVNQALYIDMALLLPGKPTPSCASPKTVCAPQSTPPSPCGRA
jgi:asparagine synthase (glutamine-hydrolysing)